MAAGEDGASEVVARIETLLREGRPVQAAEIAAKAGLHAKAAELFEQACDFGRAAGEAGIAGDHRRALMLAALAGRDDLIAQAEEKVATDANRARAAAEELRARGHAGIAARLLERIGDVQQAASMYAAAGLAVAAADAYEALGEVRQAARVLEAAHRAAPHDEDVSLRLARLLVTHRRFDAATRLLQAIPASSSHRADALPLLVTCYEALGLDDPLRAVEQEAASLGVSCRAQSQAPGPDNPDIAKVVYGRYEILRSVATTPCARVFEALDRVTNQRVALKQLRTEGLAGAGRDAFERLAREARALEHVRHPNVVPLVELVADGGSIVTPWMPGGSVSDLMERERITPARAVEIASAVLGALAEAHRLGIVHRDVKPSNILFDEAGVPRLADFGAAHVSDTSATATAGVIGTLAYMAPEQRYGQPATPASDVYGVGATLLEMLTGHPPPVTGDRPREPSSCHPDLDMSHDGVVRKLVEEDPTRRIADALEARNALASPTWPTVNRGDTLVRHRPDPGDQPLEDRLQPLEGEIHLDRWLGRRVQCVPDSAAMRRVAQAYASADTPALCSVLRLDAESGQIWFEVPDGPTMAESTRSLAGPEIEALAAALAVLHQRGVAHGSVDPHHIVLRGGSPVLAFEPGTAGDASPEHDRVALQHLARARGG